MRSFSFPFEPVAFEVFPHSRLRILTARGPAFSEPSRGDGDVIFTKTKLTRNRAGQGKRKIPQSQSTSTHGIVKAGKSNVKALCGVGMTGIRWYAVPKGGTSQETEKGREELYTLLFGGVGSLGFGSSDVIYPQS
jgi:hypothetical protein